jgi:hypothetical protein
MNDGLRYPQAVIYSYVYFCLVYDFKHYEHMFQYLTHDTPAVNRHSFVCDQVSRPL